MKYISTNKKSPSATFEEAIFLGMAPDGGLYLPESIPKFTTHEIASLQGMSLHEIASITLNKWFHGVFTHQETDEIVQKSLEFPIPLVEVGGYKVLELFHGPTYSFSDVSSRIIAHTIHKIAKRRKSKLRIILATSGDTGSSIAHTLGNMDTEVRPIVLFPKNLLSSIQLAQITRISSNVLAIEVDASYEECLNLTHKILNDKDILDLNILSGNSTNILRLIPQIIIYAYLYSLLAPKISTVVIPSGNFGNSCTALLAKLMGIPMDKIIIATNNNDAAYVYSKTGTYTPKVSVRTLASSMDIGNPSNFPRILHLCGYSHKKFLEFFDTYSITDSKVINTIHAIWSEYKYMMDPHTAVAWAAADQIDNADKTPVIIATAAPEKFSEILYKHTHLKIENDHILKELHKNNSRCISIKNNYEKLKGIIVSEFKPKEL